MFKPHTVLGFGLWLIALDFLSIGALWKIRLYVITGALFVGIYLFHLGKETIFKLANSEARREDTFSENGFTEKQKTDTSKSQSTVDSV